MTAGLDGCLAMFPETAFAALADRLSASSPAAREVRDYSRLFYSQAACVVPDRQWRVRVPLELVQWSGIGGEVMLVGVRDHIEIWPAEKWQNYVARCEPQYDQLAEAALVAPFAGRRELPETAAPVGESAPTPTQPR
jgi:MraZ protein